MASGIPLVSLIVLTLVLLGACFFLFKQETKEGFATSPYSVDQLQINTCPSFASEIQTAKGSTDCCQGDMVDGKCNGTTFCTKSPAYPGVLSCIDKWRQYFREKSINFCPPTMPNYYEDIRDPSKPKGCTAGAVTTDGTQPILKEGFTDATTSTKKECIVYASEEDNKTKIDSCFVEKQRAKVQCPVVNGSSPEATLYLDNADKSKFILLECRYPLELGMPDFCAERTTLESYFTRIEPNWRTNPRFAGNVEEFACENFIAKRERAREGANQLQAEQKKLKEAEAARLAAEKAKTEAEANSKKKADEASRLQQQLDEANRKLQSCK